MANSTCNVASEFFNLKPATATEYKNVIGEFYANHRNKWLNIVMKKGVNKLDAEDIFSSAITYMLETKTYDNYIKRSKSNKSMYKFNPKANGDDKLPCIVVLFARAIKTKIYHFFRGCKRFANALKSYITMLKSGIDLSIYVRADRKTIKAYEKDIKENRYKGGDCKNGKQKRSDGSLSDWLCQKSSESMNENCTVLPKDWYNNNIQLTAAEEQSSASVNENIVFLKKLENNLKQSFVEAA